MGKLSKICLLTISFLSSQSFASEIEALQAALKSPAVASAVPVVLKMEIINAYHCPDCFDILVSGMNGPDPAAVEVRTQSDGYHNMSVTLVPPQASSPRPPHLADYRRAPKLGTLSREDRCVDF